MSSGSVRAAEVFSGLAEFGVYHLTGDAADPEVVKDLRRIGKRRGVRFHTRKSQTDHGLPVITLIAVTPERGALRGRPPRDVLGRDLPVGGRDHRGC